MRVPAQLSTACKAAGFFSRSDDKVNSLFIALNTSHLSVTVSLPPPGGEGGKWRLLVDTSMPAPYDALVPEMNGVNLKKVSGQALQACCNAASEGLPGSRAWLHDVM